MKAVQWMKARKAQIVTTALAAGAFAMSAAPSWATDPAPVVDFAELAGGMKTDFFAAFNQYIGVILGVMVILLAIGVLIRRGKGAVKS